ncbi:acyl-CoA dehydrogenase [Mycobacterium talmoniae]|uniref:Acyl-CoA dehydrogenase n=1 Tax=Mycobacterium talmoniae TaxID=1858794 RepID=A0A1S1NPP1_9MYCO|nr:acyl-CoA dehydrogenase [Mycobacterium talmoniae]OHV06970.1 acyl-CoA dehydrogenase [Mycobacterium talmoniae]
MSFSPGQEAESLRAVVRGFLEKQSTERDVRRLMETDSGFDTDTWTRAAQELGLHGLALPEEFDGSGAGPVELGVVFEEMGAALFCGPFLSTVGLAATALLETGDLEAAAAYLPGIAAGSTTATLAWAGPTPAESTLTAEHCAGTWRVNGRAPLVLDGSTADLVLVAATTSAGSSLFAVPGPAPGLARNPLTTMDSTRKLAELGFDAIPASLIGTDGAAAGALTRTLDLAVLYLAAEQLGGAERTLAMAVEYAKTRVQFGRAIGSFQAIKHRCADMLIDVESARSVVHHGLWTAMHEPANLAVAASLARAVAADAYQRVAAQTIQIHGGIGFTWEHPAHLYVKRAKSSQLLFGSPTRYRARLAELLDLASGTPNAAVSDDTVDSTPDAAALDEDLTRFLINHPPPDPADTAADRAFREARFDAGLAVVSCAHGHGGRGLDPSLQPLVEQRMAHAGAADHTARNVIGLGMALPTIHAHGTDEQKTRYLRPCFTGAEIWCQLFSEPGAGSDLAALATRAVRDGDAYVVDGQKIWTSLGHVAHWGILLARTDPDVPKHRGLTYFLLDMHTPGVEVRPLRQLTGEAEFNEVYLTGVRIPARNVLGDVGQGWQVAMTTLANERVSLGGRPAERGSGPIGQLAEMYRTAHAAGLIDAATTEQVMLLWTRAEAARLTNARAAAQFGRQPGPEGSIAKLQMSELNKAIYELCVDLSGDDGLLIDDYAVTAPDFTAVHGGADIRKAWLRSLANSIEGGTSEILRNVLGERVLGLPGEPRTDRDIAWKDTRRS